MLQQLLQQALTHHQQGHLQLAASLYDQVLKVKPRQVDALHYRGVLALQCGQVDEGIAFIAKAIKQSPALPQPHLNLGNGLVMAGRREEALVSFGKAIALSPRYAEAHSNKANTLLELGRFDEALKAADQALTVDPQQAQAHVVRGGALRGLMRLTEALQAYDLALAAMPDHTDAWVNRAATLAMLGRREDAMEAYRLILARQPQLAEAHCDLGLLQQEAGEHLTALASFDRALQLKPSLVTAHVNRGVTLQQLGRLGDAVSDFEEALRQAPGHLHAQSNLLFTLMQSAQADAAQYLHHAKAYGAALTARVKGGLPPHAQRRGAPLDGPLRVGLVSGDLHGHPVGLFLGNLLQHLDRRRIEVHAYATLPHHDEVTEHLKAHCHEWCDAHAMSDQALAERIHRDAIHVLVDLSGHTAGHRLPVFAWKPAPLQVSWLGYLASTGVSQIDHVLADAVSAPLSMQSAFTEAIAHLPESNNCYTPPPGWQSLAVTPLPALTQGRITWGCFQSLAKISDGALSAWAEILESVTGSRLVLQNRQMADEANRALVRERLTQHGLDLARVTLRAGPADRLAYLRSHADIDIMLDTFPYPGITTTCEALFMGVPSVALGGESMLSRQGVALLASAGLPSWGTHSPESYVATAVKHATDVEALSRLREGLREQVMATSLLDGRRFAQQFADTLWNLWMNP